MGITLEQAKGLKHGQILHHVDHTNKDGSPQRWKVNGKPKVWKTMPEKVKIPLKHGLYNFDYLTEDYLDKVNIAN